MALHYFSYHDKCSTDFCPTALQNQLITNSNLPSSAPSISSSAVDANEMTTTIETSGFPDDTEGTQSYIDTGCVHVKLFLVTDMIDTRKSILF